MSTLEVKAKAIKLLILDIDGVLTNGLLYYGNGGIEMKGFHIHDGLGIKLLQKSGVAVAVITAKKAESIERRVRDLHIEHAYFGREEKLPAYEELKQKLKLNDADIAYIGDDLPDLPILRRVGLAMTVPNAPELIRQYVHLVTKNKGGKGAVREICEFILKAQDQFEAVIQSYLI